MSRKKQAGKGGAGKKSDSEKFHSSEQFRLLVESVEDYAIYMLNVDGTIKTWNPGAERIKGYTGAEIIGKHFNCFYTDGDVANGKPERNLADALRNGHVHDAGLRVRKDGSTFNAEVVITAVRDETGTLRGFAKVTRDVSEQVRAREMESAKIAAEKANQAKDDFLAALSHELRTPLTPALAAAGYLADNLSRFPSEFGEDVETIRRNVQLQARLIDDLLDLTRITRGKLELHFDRVDAHEVARQAIGVVETDAVAKRLHIETDYRARDHHVWADPIRLQQVFWNLINNAVKFTPPGGEIEIMTRNDKHGHFEFKVSDSGIGIDPQRLAALFQPFEQGDRLITRQFGGLGLGLAISKQIVEMHDGKVSAESRGRSHGSSFTVVLDVMKEHVGNASVDAHVPGRSTKGLRILLVEDHNDTRRTLSRLLSHFGHAISVAECTRTARDFVEAEKFDVVLSDIGLPDGSGYDVITHAKQNQPVKGVALTGFGSDEDVRRGKEAGFDFHLTKPVDFHELRSVLDQVSR
jgi:PAS domain S-box-containing protein